MRVLLALIALLALGAFAKDNQYVRFLDATFRDHTLLHDDFGFRQKTFAGDNIDNRVEKGIVLDTLDVDMKPVYNTALKGPDGQTDPGNGDHFGSTSGPDNFWTWYHNDDDNNVAVHWKNFLTLKAIEEGKVYQLDNEFFKPIDGKLLGEEQVDTDDDGDADVVFLHNVHFTMEVHAQFTWDPPYAEPLEFLSDDDLWVFINGQLAVDLGGRHSRTHMSVTNGGANIIDIANDAANIASTYGLVEGEDAVMSIFYAERQQDNNLNQAASIKITVPAWTNGCQMTSSQTALFERGPITTDDWKPQGNK